MPNQPFKKFSKDAVKGAKKKEAFRQEKRDAKKESAEYFAELKKSRAGVSKTDIEKRNPGKRAEVKPGKQPATQKQKPSGVTEKKPQPNEELTTGMPLNKYLAHSGICSRRDAAILIKTGKVLLNGKVHTEPGYKVKASDIITYDNKQVEKTERLVYILMNKPKDFITTAEDEKGRKTVLDLIKNHVKERVYPVGRLDRNTTGVLLLTNDGDLAQQLSHPRFEIKKVYEARLNKPMQKAHLDALVEGLQLEDGFIAADSAAYADMADKSLIGVELHSGRNRIVRRMFEHLGYEVGLLDRVMFANLTKKNVERGKWRFLNDKEIRLLKYFNKSKRK